MVKEENISQGLKLSPSRVREAMEIGGDAYVKVLAKQLVPNDEATLKEFNYALSKVSQSGLYGMDPKQNHQEIVSKLNDILPQKPCFTAGDKDYKLHQGYIKKLKANFKEYAEHYAGKRNDLPSMHELGRQSDVIYISKDGGSRRNPEPWDEASVLYEKICNKLAEAVPEGSKHDDLRQLLIDTVHTKTDSADIVETLSEPLQERWGHIGTIYENADREWKAKSPKEQAKIGVDLDRTMLAGARLRLKNLDRTTDNIHLPGWVHKMPAGAIDANDQANWQMSNPVHQDHTERLEFESKALEASFPYTLSGGQSHISHLRSEQAWKFGLTLQPQSELQIASNRQYLTNYATKEKNPFAHSGSTLAQKTFDPKTDERLNKLADTPRLSVSKPDLGTPEGKADDLPPLFPEPGSTLIAQTPLPQTGQEEPHLNDQDVTGRAEPDRLRTPSPAPSSISLTQSDLDTLFSPQSPDRGSISTTPPTSHSDSRKRSYAQSEPETPTNTTLSVKRARVEPRTRSDRGHKGR